MNLINKQSVTSPAKVYEQGIQIGLPKKF